MEGQIELEDYLRSLNCEGFDICDYIPEGRANAVTRYELCMKTGFRDRQVRDLIHYARRDGSILNLSDGKGYFRPDLDDPVERGMLAAYVRQEESRRDSIDWSLNGAIKDCKEIEVHRVYVDVNTIITAGSLLTAVVVIFSAVFAVYKWYLRQNEQDKEIERMKSEQCLLTYGILACLKGLKEQGCNGPVTEAIDKIQKHINKQAHDQED